MIPAGRQRSGAGLNVELVGPQAGILGGYQVKEHRSVARASGTGGARAVVLGLSSRAGKAGLMELDGR